MSEPNEFVEVEPTKKELRNFNSKELEKIYNEGLNVEHIFDIDDDEEEFGWY